MKIRFLIVMVPIFILSMLSIGGDGQKTPSNFWSNNLFLIPITFILSILVVAFSVLIIAAAIKILTCYIFRESKKNITTEICTIGTRNIFFF
jgi:hypothetical protein